MVWNRATLRMIMILCEDVDVDPVEPNKLMRDEFWGQNPELDQVQGKMLNGMDAMPEGMIDGIGDVSQMTGGLNPTQGQAMSEREDDNPDDLMGVDEERD